jgi:hypothetical protein
VAGEGYLSGRNRPDSARQTIHGCLEEEVGALTGGTRGKTLLASVRGELAKIRNGLGKPAGRAPSLALRHGLREFHSCPQCIIIYASLWSPTDWQQRLAELQAPTGELKEAPLRRACWA